MTRGEEDGFALVTTLWFVALLALVAVVVEGWIASSLGRAFALKERTAAHGVLISVSERLAFIMLNSEFGPRGLELGPPNSAAAATRPATSAAAASPGTSFIALDGRPYRVGNALVRLQDAGGLYDLSNSDRQTLGRLIASYGVSAPEADAMTDALIDYRGKSVDNRAGATRDAEYARAGLPSPRRAALLTPWELLRILGWQRAKAMWQNPDPLPEMVTIGPVGGLNPNTAPLRVLTAVAGMGEKEAARLIASRTLHPIADPLDIAAATGLTPGEDRPLLIVASNIIRMRIAVSGDPLLHTIAIRLTPNGPTPYRIGFAVDMPQAAAARRPADAAALPELTASAGTR